MKSLPSILGLLGVVLTLFISWCSGFNFDTRGDAAVTTALLAIIFGLCGFFGGVVATDDRLL